jgi:septum formation protein
MKQPCLILASESPRRQDLLEQAGFLFSVVPSKIDESDISHISPEKNARMLAEAKARAVGRDYPDCWVLGADTIVSIFNRILGKPTSDRDAGRMLAQLSGQAHRVYTGYALLHHDQNYLFSESVCTTVRFKTLTPGEIEWYLATNEPFDKAGAYAIQGKGAWMVRTINGSYTNVVGLPMSEVVHALARVGLAKHLFS